MNSGQSQHNASVHRKLFEFVLRRKGYLAIMAIFSLVLASTVVAQMMILSKIISTVFLERSAPATELFYFLLVSVVLRAVLIWLRERYALVKAINVKSGIRTTLLKNIIKTGGSPINQGKTGELVALVSDGVEKLEDYYARYIPSIIHLIVFSFGIALFALWYDPISGLVLLATGPLVTFFMYLIGTHAKNLSQKQWESLSALSGYFLDVIQGMKTLKVHNAQAREIHSVSAKSNMFRVRTMQVLKIAFLSAFVLELAASISIAIVALQVSIRLIEGLMVFQSGLFMLLLAPEYFLPFRQLGANHHIAMDGASAASKIFEMEREPIESGLKQMDPGIRNTVKIEVVGAGFSYPGGLQPTLHKINCTLLPGKITALVGKSGVGKTTFANLLQKHLVLEEGTILVNGAPLSEINTELWQEKIAVVSQRSHFFNSTVVDNLQMANKNASIHEIMEAATMAGIHDRIMELPHSYETMLTENALTLSAGEKQRLSIARAFLKNAPLLILDEPSANLDPVSEELITIATRRLTSGRTTVIIAHRLSSVIQADQILVFRNGTIVETGTHDHLLASQGFYADMVESFKKNFRNV